jgi:hypothetical protein
MTILAADSVPAARETTRTPAMADKPPATTALVTFRATRPVAGARETIQPAQRRPRPVSLDQSLGVLAGLIG